MEVQCNERVDSEEPRSLHLYDSVWFIVVVAFLLRVLVITLGRTYHIRLAGDHFQFGWEVGRIARALATGQGFSNPTDIITGPTAWTPPFYPYLLAGVFKLFGVYTYLSAWVILVINSMFSALTCWVLYLIADLELGRRTARWTAWTWALFPYMIYWPVRVVWETSLSCLLLSMMVLLTLRLARQHSMRTYLLLGLTWGAAALVNPALLSFAPVSFVWLAWRTGFARALRGAVVAGLLSIVIMTPWLVRNYETFGRFIFIRDNLGLEMQVANNPKSEGLWTRSEHPANTPDEREKFARMGEMAYMSEKSREASEFISTHKAQYAGWVLRRVYYFWGGKPQPTMVGSWNFLPARQTAFAITGILPFLGLYVIRQRAAAWLFAGMFILYPIPYYLAHPAPRYRHPIEGVMILLAMHFFVTIRHYRVQRRGLRIALTDRAL